MVLSQAEVNIGLFGHVDHGKTTLTHAMTGKWTDTHSEEIKRGISIRLGYADAQIYKCNKCNENSFTAKCVCGGEGKLQRNISFVDAPGHETLMTTAISASAIIDGALFLISASEACPQPQTSEHMVILEGLGIEQLVIVQTKIDLVSKEKALENYKQIKEFLSNTKYKDKEIPIIPVCAYHKININKVADAIQESIKTPKRENNAPLRMYVSRSFDVNKPGAEIQKLKGGVLGGSIAQGTLKKGQEITITPGLGKENIGHTKITAEVLRAEGEELTEAHAGGLVAVGTNLDPAIVKSDSLVGTVIGPVDNPPGCLDAMNIKFEMFKRQELMHVSLREGEPVVVNIHCATGVGVVAKVKKGVATIKLKRPIAADKGAKAALSTRIGQRWRLVAWGTLI